MSSAKTRGWQPPLTAWLCYAHDIFPKFVEFIPFMLTLALFALAIGVIIIGLIIRYITRIQTLAWSFAGLLMPFSCVGRLNARGLRQSRRRNRLNPILVESFYNPEI